MIQKELITFGVKYNILLNIIVPSFHMYHLLMPKTITSLALEAPGRKFGKLHSRNLLPDYAVSQQQTVSWILLGHEIWWPILVAEAEVESLVPISLPQGLIAPLHAVQQTHLPGMEHWWKIRLILKMKGHLRTHKCLPSWHKELRCSKDRKWSRCGCAVVSSFRLCLF